jgi:HAD superfamily hydrolase (TIGR01549 family)
VTHLNTVETLFLDAGGVLVFPNWSRISEVFASHGLTVSPEALRAADGPAKLALDLAPDAAATDGSRGALYFQGLLDLAGLPRSMEREAALQELYAYHMAHNLWELVPPDVMPALQRFQGLGLRLAVASNANGALLRMFDRVGLTPFFPTICDSAVEGVEKPDPRFFARVLERSGGRPETTLHVGDLYHVDVEGARASGLRAMLLDPGDLYGGFDVERVRTLDELADRLSLARQ